MNLLFAINKKFVFHLIKCLRSISINGGEEKYRVFVIHSDLNPKDKNLIRHNAGEKFEFSFIEADEKLFEGLPVTKRYPKQIYYRLAAPFLLPEDAEKVLYLDVDLVVINPLRELYDMDFEGNYYIACSHTGKFLTKINQKRLDLDDGVPYINTGVMMINLELLRKTSEIADIGEIIRKNAKKLILPDQDLLVTVHGNHIKLADTMRYNLSENILKIYNADPKNEKIDLQWIKRNGVIIHYCGRNKPWNKRYFGILNVFYNYL